MSSPNKRPRSEGNNTTKPQSPKGDRPHSSHNISFSQDVIYYYTPTTSPSSSAAASPATPTTLPYLTQSLSPSVDDTPPILPSLRQLLSPYVDELLTPPTILPTLSQSFSPSIDDLNDFSLLLNCSREMIDTPCEEIDKGDIRLPKMIPSIFSKGYRVDYGDYIGQDLSPVDLCSGPVTDVKYASFLARPPGHFASSSLNVLCPILRSRSFWRTENTASHSSAANPNIVSTCGLTYSHCPSMPSSAM